jgi:O-phosphoseryl-tRNA(Cys) synthetase
MSERVRSLRKSESDKKHRIYDTLQSIREAMVKVGNG